MRIVALFVFLMLLLSGCAADEPAEDGAADGTSTTSTSGTPSASNTATSTGSPAGSGQNGTLEVTIELTPRAGRAPLDVAVLVDVQARTATGEDAHPSIAWHVTAAYENGTTETVADNATLPFQTNITVGAGNHTLTAHAEADGFADATAQASLAVTEVVPDEPPGPLFYDGAENGFALWTVSSNVFFHDVFTGTEEEFPVDHPDSWVISDEGRAGNAFASGFPPNYRTRMTTTVEVPDDGAYMFSYWYRGGAESNGIDGLHVLLNGEEVAYHTNSDPDWTQFSITAPVGTLEITFRFDADPACDAATDFPNLCGAGDYVGYWVDDITIAPA